MWGKSVMYEESVGIPMIMAGPNIPENLIASTPVSLVDCYPTIIESVGEELTAEDEALPGSSLIEITREGVTDRVVFSEYHDGGSITGTFMIRTGRWKYIYHVGYPPQLFDLENDPHEVEDLGNNPVYANMCKRCKAKLRKIVNPESINAMAFNDQRKKIEKLGGEEACLQYKTFDYTPIPY